MRLKDVLICFLIIAAALVVCGPPIGHGGPRPAAQRAACQSNLKRISRAMLMYAQDNDGRLPGAGNWDSAVVRYLRKDPNATPRLFQCPSDRSAPREPGYPHSGSASYALNRRVGGRRVRDIADPESTVLLFDSSGRGTGMNGGPELLPSPPRHQERNNVAFLDGSVRSVENMPSFAAVPAGGRSPGLRRRQSNGSPSANVK
jgi:prepilin-type processing-associated H-X9-DG protein